MTQVNLSANQKQTHRHRNQTCGCQGVETWERGRVRGWGEQMQTGGQTVGRKQGPAAHHREPGSMSYDKL